MASTALLIVCLLLAAVAALLAAGWGWSQSRIRELQRQLRESERLRFELLRHNGEVRGRLQSIAAENGAAATTCATATNGAAPANGTSAAAEPDADDATNEQVAEAPSWVDTRPAPPFQSSSLFPVTQPDAPQDPR